MRIVLQQIWLKRLPRNLLLKLLPYFEMKKNNLNFPKLQCLLNVMLLFWCNILLRGNWEVKELSVTRDILGDNFAERAKLYTNTLSLSLSLPLYL